MSDRRLRLLSDTIRIVALLVGSTWRRQINGSPATIPPTATPVIFTFWHEHILPATHFFRGKYPAAIASPSKDGLILTHLLEHWSFTIINGSSSRGGMAAVRESLREIKRGKSLIVTPDGPRGPRRSAKPGVAQIAQLSGCGVITLSVKADHFIRLSSWDRFMIPLPFTTVTLTFNEPIFPTEGETAESFAKRIEESMNQDGIAL